MRINDAATITPFGYLSYNLDIEGTYGAAGIRYRRVLAPAWTLDAQVLAAVSTDLRPRDGFDHLEGGVSLTYALRDNASLQLFFNHSFAGRAIETISPDETWSGVTLSVSF